MLWDRATGEPVHNAVVWISKQTDDIVKRWSAQGLDDEFRQRTGLFNDSYFSAAKIVWLLENVPGVRRRAEAGETRVRHPRHLAAVEPHGRPLAPHRPHLRLAHRPVQPGIAELGRGALRDAGHPDGDPPGRDRLRRRLRTELARDVLGAEVPVRGVLADQQAGLFGQACFQPGSAKNTFGTAGVLVVNCRREGATGRGSHLQRRLDRRRRSPTTSSKAWCSTPARRCPGCRTTSGCSSPTTRSNTWPDWSRTPAGCTSCPAFGGMCAPHWDRDARAAVVGLTLESTAAHVVRAGMDSMAFQTADIIDALEAGGVPVDDAEGRRRRHAQRPALPAHADLSGKPVVRPTSLERTALGVAFVAGLGSGAGACPTTSTTLGTVDREFYPADGRRHRAPSSTPAGAPPSGTRRPLPNTCALTTPTPQTVGPPDERTPR